MIPLAILLELSMRTRKAPKVLFDWMGGTSTGSILATGLALTNKLMN